MHFDVEYFEKADGRKIILTHGFTKKTHKTPSSEIKIAEKYRNEYFVRKEN